MAITLSGSGSGMGINGFAFRTMSLSGGGCGLPRGIMDPMCRVARTAPRAGFPSNFGLPACVSNIGAGLSSVSLANFRNCA